MNEKDKRYEVVNKLIKAGEIIRFEQIFDVIKPFVIQKDFGIHNYRLTSLILNPEGWKFSEAYELAALFEVDEKVMVDLIHNQYLYNKEKRKGKKK